MHGRLKRPDHFLRIIRRGSYEKGREARRILRERLEHLRDWFVLQSLATHVADYSDDCEPRPV